MEVPKNCRECEHDASCTAPHYGGSRCQYKDAINRATIEQMNKKEGGATP